MPNDFEKEIEAQRKKNMADAKAGRKPRAYSLIKDSSENAQRPPRGKQYGTCKECGKQFEQEFSENRNAYSSHRICPDCRKLRSIKQQKKINESGGARKVYTAALKYNPYPWQIEAEQAFKSHRFTVLACGNRSGYESRSPLY